METMRSVFPRYLRTIGILVKFLTAILFHSILGVNILNRHWPLFREMSKSGGRWNISLYKFSPHPSSFGIFQAIGLWRIDNLCCWVSISRLSPAHKVPCRYWPYAWLSGLIHLYLKCSMRPKQLRSQNLSRHLYSLDNKWNSLWPTIGRVGNTHPK